ncbi:ribonuclease E/G [Rhodobacteraceae bacterium NNCM2]|nr:ribonuclease E/G [Coraliihabitans acroporae]
MSDRIIAIHPAGHAALLVKGRLDDLLLEPAPGDALPRPGETFWAKIDRTAPATGGAFVKLTAAHQGFLRETKGVKQGAGLLVQVSGYAEPGKAVPVSRRLLFKSALVILTPDAPGINVSRRIREPEERERLTRLATDLTGEEAGLILRSAAEGATAEALAAAITEVEEARAAAEALTNTPPPLAGPRLTGADIARREWEGQVREGATIFEGLGIPEQIEALASPEAPLPSGGSMVIEATRALVAVDVNTGPNFSAGAAMTTNIEAIRELPRQLRLRGLGGQITIDFAPIKKMHRRKIEETLRTAFRACPVETTLAGWTPLGNFELQRKRERRPLTSRDFASFLG